MSDPVKVAVTPVASTVDNVEQSAYYVNKNNKIDLLIHLLRDKGVVSALVFSRTKHGADKIAKRLTLSGIAGDVIHSNKSQNARELALSRFKQGQSRVLVATDIVARGIDINELSHVINFDLPEVPEAYVHRIGRTARAGLGGNAVSFCDESGKEAPQRHRKAHRQENPRGLKPPLPAGGDGGRHRAKKRPASETIHRKPLFRQAAEPQHRLQIHPLRIGRQALIQVTETKHNPPPDMAAGFSLFRTYMTTARSKNLISSIDIHFTCIED